MRKLLGITVCALTVPFVSVAQDKGPQLSTLVSYKVKPDMRAEFEALQKDLSAAYKKAGTPSRIVVQTVLGDINEWVSISPIAKFADLDGAGPLERALGQEGYASIMRRGAGMVTDVHRMVTAARPDLSIRTDSAEPGMFALVVTVNPVMGKRMELEKLMKSDVMPAFKKVGTKHLWASEAVFGGEGGTMFFVLPVEKIAAFDAGPLLVRALGMEGAQKLELRMGPLIASEHFALMRVRPDLSWMGAPNTTASK